MFFDNYCTKAKKLSEEKVPNFKGCTGHKNLAKRDRRENMEAFKSLDSS
jgi:hypothetical protein